MIQPTHRNSLIHESRNSIMTVACAALFVILAVLSISYGCIGPADAENGRDSDTDRNDGCESVRSAARRSSKERIYCRYVGEYDTGDRALDVALHGDHAFIADNENGLVIVNISEKEHLSEEAVFDTGGKSVGVEISGRYAYIADDEEGLVILDIDNISDPRPVGELDTEGNTRDVRVSGDNAFIADNGNGFLVVDIGNRSDPVQIGHYETPAARAVDISGNHAFVADRENGLVILDISNCSSPGFVAGYDTEGSAEGVAVAGDYVYVADGSHGLVIINITDMENPTRIGIYDTPNYASDVVVSGEYAYLSDGTNGLVAVDIRSVKMPSRAGGFESQDFSYGVAYRAGYVYVADSKAGLLVAETAPIAHISEIAPDPAVYGDVLQFSAEGTGSAPIVRYIWQSSINDELYNGSNAVFSSSNLSIGDHIISLSVEDANGIRSEETNITLTVLEHPPPNQRPVISISSPDNNSQVSGTVYVSTSLSDPDGDYSTLEMSVNGGEWSQPSEIGGSVFFFGMNWDSTDVENGECEIHFRAFDGEDYSDIAVLALVVENEKSDEKNDDDDDDDKSWKEMIGEMSVWECFIVIVFLSPIAILVYLDHYFEKNREEIVARHRWMRNQYLRTAFWLITKKPYSIFMIFIISFLPGYHDGEISSSGIIMGCILGITSFIVLVVAARHMLFDRDG